MTAVIQLAISRDILLTSNQRLHWAAKARSTRAIRDMAHVMARFERPKKMSAATCVAEVTWPDRRERDAHNLQPTVKAALDGVIGDYGLLPSDSDKHLKSLQFTASEKTHDTPGVACFIQLRFTEVQI
jgi:crossover junction endodeoxyribonuclease RusA